MRSLLPFAALISIITAHNTLVEHIEAHHARIAAKGYQLLRRAHPKAPIQLTIAVTQQNIDRLTEILYDVSDPTSISYGAHLGHEAIQELVRPSDESVSAVLQWLQLHGIQQTSTTAGSDFIVAQATIAQAEALMGQEYWEYVHQVATMCALSDG